MGDVTDLSHFIGAVIDDRAFAKKTRRPSTGRRADPACTRFVAGGTYDDSVGYFVRPTVIECTDPANDPGRSCRPSRRTPRRSGPGPHAGPTARRPARHRRSGRPWPVGPARPRRPRASPGRRRRTSPVGVDLLPGRLEHRGSGALRRVADAGGLGRASQPGAERRRSGSRPLPRRSAGTRRRAAAHQERPTGQGPVGLDRVDDRLQRSGCRGR